MSAKHRLIRLVSNLLSNKVERNRQCQFYGILVRSTQNIILASIMYLSLTKSIKIFIAADFSGSTDAKNGKTKQRPTIEINPLRFQFQEPISRHLPNAFNPWANYKTKWKLVKTQNCKKISPRWWARSPVPNHYRGYESDRHTSIDSETGYIGMVTENHLCRFPVSLNVTWSQVNPIDSNELPRIRTKLINKSKFDIF